MEDKELYEKLLGVKEPWDVIDVAIDMQKDFAALFSRMNLKVRACGFCNRARFKMAILFHCGKLSLLPEVLS